MNLTPEQDKRWWLLSGRIKKMEAMQHKYAGFPHMVKTNHALREALKAKYGVYPEWTDTYEQKWRNKMKRMEAIKFIWVVELTNLSCQ
jgi:hypothetical protein